MAATSRKGAWWILVRLLPLLPLVVAFFGLVGYISWSYHLFTPLAPKLQVNCTELQNSTNLENYFKNRTVTHGLNGSNESLSNRCWDIKKRWYMPGEVPDSMEVHHPVYYIRIVSKHYLFFEEVFNMMFSPIHFYCYPIADSANESFESKVRLLGACVLNVIVPEGKFDTSNATDIFRAHQACFYRMGGFNWEHVLISQENQIPLQSVHFLSDLMRRVGAASKVGHGILTEENTRVLNDSTLPSYAETKDLLLHDVCNWLHGKKEIIGLSRPAAEIFYPLVLNATLQNCLQPGPKEGCISKHFDGDNHCIWGMESINQAEKSKSLFARADPTFDMGFVQCVHEFVFHRTYDTDFYQIKYGSH